MQTIVGGPAGGAQPSRGRFAVAAEPRCGGVVLALSGELDHDTAQDLVAVLDEPAAAGARILVDCSQLDFCDSSGLNTLLRAHSTAVRAGGELILFGVRGPVARLLGLTGMDRVFPQFPDLAAALAAPGRPDAAERR